MGNPIKFSTVGALTLAALILSVPLRARQDGPKSPADSQSASPQESSSKRTVNPPPTETPAYNPLPAEKDVEVGTFYMHKGDLDAAISRFEDAIAARPNYAKPRLLMAEAYEKKHDKEQAVKFYKEYLRVFRDAPDAKSVQKKIDQVSRK